MTQVGVLIMIMMRMTKMTKMRTPATQIDVPVHLSRLEEVSEHVSELAEPRSMARLTSPALRHDPVDFPRSKLWLRHPVVVHQHVEETVASLQAGIRCLAETKKLPEDDAKCPNVGLRRKHPVPNALNCEPLNWQRPVRFLLVVAGLVYILIQAACLLSIIRRMQR